MYSERHVARRIALAEQEFHEELNGRSLVYRTVDEIDEFNDHLRKHQKLVYDSQGQVTGVQNLERWEQQYIVNERALVMSDAAYGLTRYCFIKDEKNIVTRFGFRIPQRIIFNIIADLEDMDASIEIMFLKARQLGVSTIIELLIGMRIILSYGVNAVIASADRQKSILMANMVFMMYDMFPPWLKPKWTQRVQSEQGKLVFGMLNSGVSIQHGSQMSGIARGWTPTIYHLSECASFTDPVNQIEASLFKAVHASPQVFGVLESTGEGDEGWWPDTWRYAKTHWPRRRSRLCPLFLPWFCGVDIYPTPTWIRMRPVPGLWYQKRLPDTRAHVAKAEAYVRTHPLLSKHLGPNWKMPLEQQWFWEVGHEEHKAKGLEATWYQEMAGDDIEALQKSAESVFGNDTIEVINDTRVKTPEVYGFSGQSIEDAHEPPTDDIDYDKERVPVSFISPRGEVYRWELIPLKYDVDYVEELRSSGERDNFFEYANGKFFVYRPPEPNVDYSIGVDTSNGMGKDSSVVSVTAVGRRGMPDVQVAEFRSAYVSHVEVYAFAMCVAAYYSTQYGASVNMNARQPLVGVEQLAAVGDTCQLQMRKMGYSRFHLFVRYDSKKIQKSKARKMGWFTTIWSRPMLIDGFVHSLQNGWYVLNSPWTLHECAHFEVTYTASGKEKKQHEDGENDDGIFATAISTFIAHDLETMTERSKKRFVGSLSDGVRPPLDISPGGWKVPTRTPRPVTTSDILYATDDRLERYRHG